MPALRCVLGFQWTKMLWGRDQGLMSLSYVPSNLRAPHPRVARIHGHAPADSISRSRSTGDKKSSHVPYTCLVHGS
jgi:hypothetical protein